MLRPFKCDTFPTHYLPAWRSNSQNCNFSSSIIHLFARFSGEIINWCNWRFFTPRLQMCLAYKSLHKQPRLHCVQKRRQSRIVWLQFIGSPCSPTEGSDQGLRWRLIGPWKKCSRKWGLLVSLFFCFVFCLPWNTETVFLLCMFLKGLINSRTYSGSAAFVISRLSVWNVSLCVIVTKFLIQGTLEWVGWPLQNICFSTVELPIRKPLK